MKTIVINPDGSVTVTEPGAKDATGADTSTTWSFRTLAEAAKQLGEFSTVLTAPQLKQLQDAAVAAKVKV